MAPDHTVSHSAGGAERGSPPRRSWVSPAVAAFAVLLALFVGARVVLLRTQSDVFADLSDADRWRALARGAWFDVVTILRVAGAPLVLSALPLPGRFGARWRRAWSWVVGALATILGLLLAADILYFPYITRHFGPEIVLIGENFGVVTEVVVTEHFLALVAFTATLVVLALVWRRLAARAMQVRDGAAAWIAVIAVAALAAIGARGTLADRRLLVTNAFEGLPASGAQLALNGPFVLMSWLEKGLPDRRYFEWEQAVAEAKALYFARGESGVDEARPLLRARRDATPRRWNVVIVLLEGWSADSVDAYRADAGLAPLGTTPRFDEYAKRGWRFTRAFALGQRTLYGYQALLTGVPSLPGVPMLCGGLESSPLAYLPRLARDEGWSTWLVQATPIGSQRIEWIGDLLGFQNVIGLEGFSQRDSNHNAVYAERGYDHELYAEAERRLAAAPSPWFAVVKTESTHGPHQWPDPKWARFGEATADETYLNSLAYADDALGAFLDRMRAAGRDADTVFVVISDHIQRGRSDASQYPPNLFRIPFFMLVPGAPAREWNAVASQLDVIPTLVELIGWRGAQASFGRSLLDESEEIPRGATCHWGDLVVRVEKNGWVMHDLERRVAAGGDERGGAASSAELDAIERRLLSTVQVTTTLLAKQAVAR